MNNQRAVQFLSNRTLNPISDIMHILGWNSASKQNGNTPKDSFEKKANCILNLVDWNTYCSQSGLSKDHLICYTRNQALSIDVLDWGQESELSLYKLN